MHDNPKIGEGEVKREARQRARACILAGACCMAGAFELPIVLAAQPWLAPWLNPYPLHAVVVGAAAILFLLWMGIGAACLHRARMMLMLGTPEEREQKKREFASRVAQAEAFLEMRCPN